MPPEEVFENVEGGQGAPGAPAPRHLLQRLGRWALRAEQESGEDLALPRRHIFEGVIVVQELEEEAVDGGWAYAVEGEEAAAGLVPRRAAQGSFKLGFGGERLGAAQDGDSAVADLEVAERLFRDAGQVFWLPEGVQGFAIELQDRAVGGEQCFHHLDGAMDGGVLESDEDDEGLVKGVAGAHPHSPPAFDDGTQHRVVPKGEIEGREIGGEIEAPGEFVKGGTLLRLGQG